MKLKVCGLKDRENIEKVLACGPDYFGFIFYKKSPRYVADLSPEFVQGITGVKKVGVFVNENEINILDSVSRYGLDLVQLYGDERPEFCSLIRRSVPVIKAFQISETFDFSSLALYANCCDHFLFDSKSDNYGGSGKSFDHKKLEEYSFDKTVFLSGGLNLNITEDISYLNSVHPKVFAIDVNSRFELSPGIKDEKKVKVLIDKLKQHEFQTR